MIMEHVAFAVQYPNDIEAYYMDILGFEKQKEFVLKQALANQIFGIEEDVEVCLLKKGQVVLELFISPMVFQKNYNHICISVEDREKIVNEAMTKSFEVVRVEREVFDLIFLKDRSGNIIELKTIKPCA